MNSNSKNLREFINIIRQKLVQGNVTILYDAKDEVNNYAIILKDLD
jgi:uncharacterized protein YeaO (DUF488 family)